MHLIKVLNLIYFSKHVASFFTIKYNNKKGKYNKGKYNFVSYLFYNNKFRKYIFLVYFF